MKSTQRYGIEYPAPTDLVSGASDQFERMANSMEKAMAGVDDRVIHSTLHKASMDKPASSRRKQITSPPMSGKEQAGSLCAREHGTRH